MKYQKGDVILFLTDKTYHSVSYCIGIDIEIVIVKDLCANSYKPTHKTLYIDINHMATAKNFKLFHWED